MPDFCLSMKFDQLVRSLSLKDSIVFFCTVEERFPITFQESYFFVSVFFLNFQFLIIISLRRCFSSTKTICFILATKWLAFMF